ncbi:hypothetical protein Vretimale_5185 [Volvox reticuliferus]|uniref:Uncharacterized protein n=1 Tax=Volvox reticuliferus TaxID=1737510 RepID=A0A8J4C300_9CHLO|nr:hypothetical protein Vretifemale_3715 [Volvox reticuliferus]GIM00396.1 hypothetical protein Vretimale_5185 [Volvox reticuliferus]
MQTLMEGQILIGVNNPVGWPNPCPGSSAIPRLLCQAYRSKPARGLNILARTVKEGRKSTSGVKGEGSRTGSSRSTASGGGTGSSSSRTTSGRKDGSNTTRPSTPSPQPQPQQQRQAKQQAQPPRRSASPSSGAAQGGSRLDSYMRKHPLLSRFYDTTLLLGDCVMILATEASSERIEWSSFPALVGVLLVCWVTAGAWNGDYSPGGSRAHEDVPWQLSMLGPTFGSVLGAALTWAFASTASVAAYAVLVARNALDAAPVVEGLNSDDLSPQLEVVVALLITMTCWRGIVSKLRPLPPGSSD